MQAINKFDDIEHMPLRVYNRAAMAFNLLEDFGEKSMEEYLSAFTDDERKQIFILTAYIQQKGLKAAKEFVTKDLKIEYSVGEDDETSG